MGEIPDNDGMMSLDDRVPYWKDDIVLEVMPEYWREVRMKEGCHKDDRLP